MPGQPNELPRLYLPAEVAEALRCSTWWVMEQVRKGRFPHEEIAGGYRFTAEQYATIVRRCEAIPGEDPPAVQPEPAALPTVTAGLEARVPRRLRRIPPIDSAA